MDETFNSSSNHSDTNMPCSSSMTAAATLPSCSSSGSTACDEKSAVSKKSAKSSHFLHDILDIKSNENNQLVSLMPRQELNNFSIISNLANSASLANNLAFSFAFNSSLKSSYESSLQAVNASASRHRLVECVVCHDKSSGKHYGQFTCEGCKSFFKRSVRRNLTYQCRSAKNCPIDQHHRNQCQHCRFKKCIKMGMRREAVQRGRTPIMPGVNKCTLNMTKQRQLEQNDPSDLSEFCSSKSTSQSLISMLPAFHANDLMCSFSSKIILNIFEWTLSFGIFSAISANDRIELLLNAWPELFVIFAAQSSISADDLRWSSSSRVSQDDPDGNESDNDPFTDEEVSIENFKFQLTRIRSLNLDHDEYNYFKAIVLFNPGTNENRDLFFIGFYSNDMFFFNLFFVQNRLVKTREQRFD